MLKEERYDRILEILEEETYTNAHTLAERLYVSMPTIRRDLAELSRKNLIVRSHGGAKKIGTEHIITPVSFRKNINYKEKRRIAKKAASLVKDNQIIFIDASTTAFNMGEFLSGKKGITVVTNGIPLGVLLAEKGIKTYCTGGEIISNSHGYAGSFAQNFVKGFNFDLCFFSCYALGADGIISDTSVEENLVRAEAVKNSEKTIFLCDSSKFSMTAPFNLMNVNDVDYVITDAEVIPKIVDRKKCLQV